MCGPCTRLLGVCFVPGPGNAITVAGVHVSPDYDDGPARNKHVKRPLRQTPGRRTDRAFSKDLTSGQDADGDASNDSTGDSTGASTDGSAELPLDGEQATRAAPRAMSMMTRLSIIGILQLGCGQGRRAADDRSTPSGGGRDDATGRGPTPTSVHGRATLQGPRRSVAMHP